jgi:hypothetical protein
MEKNRGEEFLPQRRVEPKEINVNKLRRGSAIDGEYNKFCHKFSLF